MTPKLRAAVALGPTDVLAEAPIEPDCDLCEAAHITERYFSDRLCWIAECEMCAVPMVVWRSHDAHPGSDLRTEMLGHLRDVVDEHFGYEVWIDENMRSIPEHYHAHARPMSGFFGHGLRRRGNSPQDERKSDSE